MCVEAKTNPYSLVSPDLNPIEQLWDDLRCIRDRSVQPWNLRQLHVLSIKNGLGLPRMVCDVTCFQFDLVMMLLLLQERVMPVLDEFNSSKLNWTRSRYSFSSEKLVIFENDPLSIHWRTA